MPITKDGPIVSATTTIKDSTGKPVKVPGGFKIASDSADNVNDGVVIEDGRGNQFVWIPVTDGSKYVRNTTYEEAVIPATAYDDTSLGYLPSGVTNEKETVLKAGGFFVARYEAGTENDILVSKKNVTSVVTRVS